MANTQVKVELPVKVILNEQKNKVLFAEVDSDFADVLLSFLALPVGTIVRLLSKHYKNQEILPSLGSFTSLYQSISNLDTKYFCSEIGRDMLLNPRSSFEDECRNLKINIDDTPPTKYYACKDWTVADTNYCTKVSMFHKNMTCYSGKEMNTEICFNLPTIQAKGCGVFTTRTASFIVSEDLQIFNNLPLVAIQILKQYGITDTNGLEERTVNFGMKEVLDLLKGSLFSKTPLTDVIFQKGPLLFKSELEASLPPQMDTSAASLHPTKISIEVIVHKSTNKVLFVQTKDEFVDFLFGLLTIPMGGILKLLKTNQSSIGGSICNLYRTLSNLTLKDQLGDNALHEPRLLEGYISYNTVLPLKQKSIPVSYNFPGQSNTFRSQYASLKLIDPKDGGNYVKGPNYFMVTDDLFVTPSSAFSGISMINRMDIPVTDVEERVINIGLQEATSILHASLTSTSALSDGLKPFINKIQPKQEK